jgi:hypothetical protein
MKLLELTNWQELMKQASWTIDYWYEAGSKLGIKGEAEKLKYAELCLREFETSAKLRVADEALEFGESLLGRVDELTEVIKERTT